MNIFNTWLGRRSASGIVFLGSLAVFSADVSASTEQSKSTTVAASFQSLVDSDLIVIGPVEAVRPAESTISVLGQLFALPLSLSTTSVGDLVAVRGSVKSDGTYVVTHLTNLGSVYVDGATELFLKGTVKSVDTTAGTLRIGSLSINYTAALPSLTVESIETGKVAAFGGLAYSKIASLYASNGAVLAKSEGQVGGNLETLGQVGGNALSHGQVGGNLETRGQVGGNLETLGQVGGNALSHGQVGGNALSHGQVGGNIETRGQVGGNLETLGQVGGNALSHGQVGGNVLSHGQVGGNLQTHGQVGGNLETLGQVGGNVEKRGQVGGNLETLGQVGGNVSIR